MFFETTDFSVSNVSAFHLSWEKNNGNSGVRPFHALSFRIVGEAQFASEAGVVHVKSNDIIFCPAYCKYHLTSGAEQLFVVHFNTDLPIASAIQAFSPHDPLAYRQYFEKIVDIYTKKEVGFEHKCKSLLYTVIAAMERDSQNEKTADRDEEMQQAIRYIHQHFTQKNIAVHELAAMCSMSETYFRKRFARVCGCTPLAYINALRAEHAVEMLKTTYYTVSEVSEKCGFSTPYYFSNFIKKKTGLSPRDFTKNSAEKSQ